MTTKHQSGSGSSGSRRSNRTIGKLVPAALAATAGLGWAWNAAARSETTGPEVRYTVIEQGETVFAVAMNPAYEDQFGSRALPTVPSLIKLDITPSSGFFSADGRTVTVNSTFGFKDETDTGYIVEGFGAGIVSIRTASQLGFGPGVTFAPMFAAYFAANPSAHAAWGWTTSRTNAATPSGATLSNFAPSLPTNLKSHDRCGEKVGYRLTMSASPNLGPGGVCGLRYSGTLSANKLCFYGNYPDFSSPVGHGFVELRQTSDSGTSSRFAGKYPRFKYQVFNEPGEIRDDAGEPWNGRICFPVTSEQYRRASILVTEQKRLSDQNPPGITYHVLSANCMDFIQSVAQAAGVALPFMQSLFISDPAMFVENLLLDSLFQPRPGCGRINFSLREDGGPGERTVVRAGTGATFSATALIELGLADPIGTANELGHPLNRPAMTPHTLRAGEQLVIQLNNAGENSSLRGVDWGDGEPFEAMQMQYTRTFASAGSFTVRAVVIDQSAVHHYEIPVTVTSSAPAGPVNIPINVPSLPPVYTPAPLPPPLEGSVPDHFVVTNPPPGVTGVGLGPALQWQASDGAATYQLVLATSPDFGAPVFTATLEGTEFAVPRGGLRPGTSYFWRVTGVGDNGLFITDGTPTPAAFTTVAATCAQDIDGTGVVDTLDLVLLLNGFGRELTYFTARRDINADGAVDTADLISFLPRFGLACP